MRPECKLSCKLELIDRLEPVPAFVPVSPRFSRPYSSLFSHTTRSFAVNVASTALHVHPVFAEDQSEKPGIEPPTENPI